MFLDGLRVVAALTVFATHIDKILFADAIWLPGHAMVIVFFVLSGYVIAFSTLGRAGLTAKKYVIARLSRLYSVVIPALLLTALLLVIGRAINPTFYAQVLLDHEVTRFFATGFFLQSIWWRNIVPPDNGPFWSLGYEFWYYVIFGVAVFVKNWKWKTALILACCLIVGENVLLLFPIWLLGAGVYLYRDAWPIPRVLAAIGFIAMLVIMVVSMFTLPEFPAKVGDAPLFYSASYPMDWILGLELGALIWLYTCAFDAVSFPEGFVRVVQWAANHTFSIYLYHYPIILFFYALGIFHPEVWWQGSLEVGLILALIIGLSELTESKRGLWKKALEKIWARWEPAPALVAEN